MIKFIEKFVSNRGVKNIRRIKNRRGGFDLFGVFPSKGNNLYFRMEVIKADKHSQISLWLGDAELCLKNVGSNMYDVYAYTDFLSARGEADRHVMERLVERFFNEF